MAPNLPPESASAKQIQEFITQTLIIRLGCTPEFAGEKGALWAVGHGADLRAASARDFERIFGANVGLCLFRSVVDNKDEEWKASITGNITCGFLWIALLLALLSIIRWGFSQPYTNYVLLLQGAAQIYYFCARPKRDNRDLTLGLFNLGLNAFVLLKYY